MELLRRVTEVTVNCIYVIEAVGYNRCKVGISSDPDMRMVELQRYSPMKLNLVKIIPVGVKARLVEQKAHERLWSRRLWGEWFEVSTLAAVNAIEVATNGVLRPRVRSEPTTNKESSYTCSAWVLGC